MVYIGSVLDQETQKLKTEFLVLSTHLAEVLQGCMTNYILRIYAGASIQKKLESFEVLNRRTTGHADNSLSS
jgi:hypothetical protein